MKEIDERGRNCPLPVIDTKEAIISGSSGDELCIIVDNNIAVQNVKKLLKHFSMESKTDIISETEFRIYTVINKNETITERNNENVNQKSEEETVSCFHDIIKKGQVIVISSDQMGEPNEELGKLLMNGFIFALLKQDKLPEKIIFYNGGARLSCEGSQVLEDLKEMSAMGVDIITCGTCVKTLGIEDKVQVGRVSNMYEICELMTNAGSLVKP
ncbi:MAG: sulfurtransferase-like selenium metabolism protein YedF [Eubacteriales bacterium]|nr:sulfurtransferase-like selenium metabolism protein YedF [Eubacteriales bacterium]